MNASEQIINVLNALCAKIGVSIDWTSTNVLPYLQTLCERYAKYVTASSIFYIVFAGGGLLAIAVGLLMFIRKKHNNIDWRYDMYPYVLIGLSAILIFISLIVISVNAGDIIKAITVPEALIADYVKNIMMH